MVRIKVLGEVGVERDGQLEPVPGRVLPLVLAVLASRANRPVPTDVLLDALWPDDRRRGRASLQVHISRLRGLLGESRPPRLLRTVPGGYRLDVTVDQLDVLAFEQAMEHGLDAARSGDAAAAAPLLQEALRGWAEPFGGHGPHPLLSVEYRRLHELRANAEDELCESWLALGCNVEAIDRLALLIEEEPLRERRWGQRMLALYRAGRQSEALRCYQQLRRLLGDELGVEPAPGLRRLEEAILLHDPRLALADREVAAQPLNNLPPAVALVGRDDAVATVRNLVGASRVVTLAGAGGVGKTRVALGAAHELVRDASFDGVYFVALEGVRDGSLVASAVADAIGLRGADLATVLRVITANLAGRKVLLVLDNVEHLLADAACTIEGLLGASRLLRVLVTSRQPLDLDEESVYRLPPLAVPPLDASPEALVASPAVALFLERSAAPPPTDATALEAIATVCRELGGNPLAIELAAARTVTMTPTDLVERLGRQLGLLRSPRVATRPRHGSIEASVAWSFSLLADDEQILLRRLGVFRGGFSLDTCVAVVVDEQLPEDRVLGLLDALVHKSLLAATELAGLRWFTISATLAEFAYKLLDDHGRRDEFERRHRDAYLAFVQHAARNLVDQAATVIPRLHAEHHNIRAALRYSIDHGHRTEAIAIAFSASLFWLVHGYITEGRRWFDELVELGEPTDALSRGRLSQSLGLLASVDADLPNAERHYRDADAGFGAAGPVAEVLRGWNRFWWARTITGQAFLGYAPISDVDRSVELYRGAIDAFRRHDNWNGVLTTLPFLAIAEVVRGGDGARASLHELEAAARLLDTDRGIAIGHMAWAMVQLVARDHVSAAAHATDAAEMCSANADRHNESIAWALVALAAAGAGDIDRARASTRDLLRLHRRNNTRLYASFFLSVAWLTFARGDDPAAADARASLDLMHPRWPRPLRVLGFDDPTFDDSNFDTPGPHVPVTLRWPSWTAAHDRALNALSR